MLFTHAHIFSPEYWSECMNAKYAEGDWSNFFERYHANLIVVEPATHSELVSAIKNDSRWIVVEYDEFHFLALRRPAAK